MYQASISPEHIVFIPGFMCDERLFEPQTHALLNIEHSFTVEILKTQDTIRDMSRAILETSPTQFALTGLSMGGIIALDIAHIAPHRVTHLALLNTTPYEDRSSLQRIEHMRRVREGELLNILKDDLKPQYLSPSTSKAKLMPLVTDMGRELGEEVFTRQSTALLTRASSLEHLSDIGCPTLIVTGEDDSLCPPGIHQKMAERIKNSDLKIIPNCGHLSTLEAPEILTEYLFKHWGFAPPRPELQSKKTRLPETV